MNFPTQLTHSNSNHCPVYDIPPTLIRTNNNILRPILIALYTFFSFSCFFYLFFIKQRKWSDMFYHQITPTSKANIAQHKHRKWTGKTPKIKYELHNWIKILFSNGWEAAISSIFATDAFTFLLIWLLIFFSPIKTVKLKKNNFLYIFSSMFSALPLSLALSPLSIFHSLIL